MPVLVICRNIQQFRRHLDRFRRMFPDRRVLFGGAHSTTQRYHAQAQLIYMPGWDCCAELRRDAVLMRYLNTKYVEAYTNSKECDRHE